MNFLTDDERSSGGAGTSGASSGGAGASSAVAPARRDGTASVLAGAHGGRAGTTFPCEAGKAAGAVRAVRPQ